MHLLSCLLQTALGFSEWLWLEGIMSLSGFWQEVFSFPISMLAIRNLPPPLKSPRLCSYFSCCPLLSFIVQSLSHVQLFATPWTATHQAFLSITNSRSLLKCMSIESVMPFNHLILCRPLLPPPSIFPSIRVFSNESALPIRWPKYWSFSFSISPSNEYSGLISFRMDWLDLLAVQGTLKSLLQYHSLKESILLCSAFFIVQLSHPYRYPIFAVLHSPWGDCCFLHLPPLGPQCFHFVFLTLQYLL